MLGWALSLKGCVEEEGDSRLSPSSTGVVGCVRVSVDCAIVPSSSRMSLAEAVWISLYDCSQWRRHPGCGYAAECFVVVVHAELCCTTSSDVGCGCFRCCCCLW